MNLKIYSININGFRSKHKQVYIKNFLKQNNIDILCIQETYVDTFFLSKRIENALGLNTRCVWAYGQSNSKGTAIIINNPSIQINKFQTDFIGRSCYVDFEFFDNKFRLVTVYAPNTPGDQTIFFKDLCPFLTTSNKLLIAGDFNFIFDLKCDKIGGNREKTNGSKIFKNFIDRYKLIDAFRYKYPDKRMVTWSAHNNSVGCRLDRFYITKLFQTCINDSFIVPCSKSDHDFIALELNISEGISIGKSYWKLNNQILKMNYLKVY